MIITTNPWKEYRYSTGKNHEKCLSKTTITPFFTMSFLSLLFPFLTPFLAATLSDGKIAFSLPCHFLGQISTKNDDIKVRLNSFFPSAWCSYIINGGFLWTFVYFGEVDKWKRAKNCYLFFCVRLAKLKPGISRSSSDIICNCVTHSFGQKRLTEV